MTIKPPIRQPPAMCGRMQCPHYVAAASHGYKPEVIFWLEHAVETVKLRYPADDVFLLEFKQV